MNLIESVKRLKYTFTHKNKPNDTDVLALNALLKHVNDIQTRNVEDNRTYAKLLALFIKFQYERTNNLDEMIKSIEKELLKPLEFHISILSNKIRANELTEYIKTLTVDVNENDLQDVEVLTEKENEFWSVNEKHIFQKINEMYSEEAIRDKFYATANQILANEKFRV